MPPPEGLNAGIPFGLPGYRLISHNSAAFLRHPCYIRVTPGCQLGETLFPNRKGSLGGRELEIIFNKGAVPILPMPWA